MRVVTLMGAILALSACGVPESEDTQASREAIRGHYFVSFDPEILNGSRAWQAALVEYRDDI